MILSNAAIHNRTTVLVLMVLIVIAGAYSYTKLPRESAPEVKMPRILVTTPHQGVSPEDVENTVTNKIEKELTGLKGLKEIRSTSMEGLSIIQVDFQPNVDIDNARQLVKDKVDLAKPELPSNADQPVEPVITEINFAEFPILTISMYGDLSPVRMKAIAEEVQDELEALPGVLEVDLIGTRERQIVIEMDPDRVAEYGLTTAEILSLIPSENVNQSAGGVETEGTKFNLRVPAEFDDPSIIDKLPVATRIGENGQSMKIYLSDVAEVHDSFADRESFSRLDGEPSVTLAVKKRVGSNLVEIADAVKAVLEEARKRVPLGVRFELTDDRSKEIRNMVLDLENNIASALVLVVFVLILFMGARSSFIVALAIPMSMLISFSVLLLMGVTLNMVVLFSLILALGMLVDNAIVIVENIYRFMEMGYDRIDSAIRGAAEVAWPVIASTATTVAAFTPLLFWPDIVGDFMKYIPMTVIVVLTSSLFVALVINPVICSIFGKPRTVGRREDHWFLNGYRRLLGIVLRHPLTTVTGAMLVLVAVGITYAKFGKGIEFFPDADPDQGVINVRAPQGTSIEESDRIARLIEQRIAPLIQENGNVRVDNVVTGVGSESGGFGGGSNGSHYANIRVIFPDYEDRVDPNGVEWESDDVLEQMREVVKGVGGAEVRVEKEEAGPPTGSAVTIRLTGEDMNELKKLKDLVLARIEDVPNLVNLRTDLEDEKPELAFIPDRQRIADFGVSTSVVSNFLKTSVFGSKVGEYREFSDEYDIRIRLPLTDRQKIDDILRLRVPTNAGTSVPISSLGHFEFRPGMGTIYRFDRKRAVTIEGDAEGRLDDEVLKDVMDRLDPIGETALTPPSVTDWSAIRTLLSGQAKGDAEELVRRIAERLPMPARVFGRVDKLLADEDWDDEQKAQAIGLVNKAMSGLDLSDLAEDFVQEKGQLKELLEIDPKKRTDKQTQRINRLVLAEVFPQALPTVAPLVVPTDYRLTYAGAKEEQDKAQSFLTFAFLLALLLIVMILVTQFNTFSAPLIIMTTVLLSMIGVLVGLLVTGLPFGLVMTGVGVISLAGVVVNNAIVLLDYTRQLQRRGKDVVEAAIEAGTTRLRPVLLTATTTVLGLIPMATGISFDFHTFHWATRSSSSQWWSSMANAVIFGLGFATMLTLLVVPSLYVMLYRLAARLGLGGLQHVHGKSEEHEIEMEDY